jgi:hypothetical protein
LETEADRAARIFGGVAVERPPSGDILAMVDGILGASGEGLGRLGSRELRAVPYLIWEANSRWTDDRAFIHAYLSRVDLKWPSGLRRLWRHHVLNFDAGSAATVEMAAWFGRNRQRLQGMLRAFSESYGLFDAGTADRLGAAAISGRLIADLEAVGLGASVVRSSALCVSALDAAGGLLASAPDQVDVAGRLRELLDGNPVNAIAEAVCSAAARPRALRSIVDGLVAWQKRCDPGDGAFDAVLDFLLDLNGDPRFTPDRWHGRVSGDAVTAVEGWLSRRTIELFFQIIDRLNSDRADMWESRREFWLAYLPFITGAWLVAGPDAAAIAKQQEAGFATFAGGGGQAHDHCGLILRIGPVCVMEMNKNGAAIFWTAGSRKLPDLFARSYDRRAYRDMAGARNVLGHRGSWQRIFSAHIHSMGGPLVRRF